MWSNIVSIGRLRALGRNGLYLANALTAAILVATPAQCTPIEAFRHGTIGTELMPLAVVQVLPDLFGDDRPFHPIEPDGSKCKDWMRCFSFIASPAGDGDWLPSSQLTRSIRRGGPCRRPSRVK